MPRFIISSFLFFLCCFSFGFFSNEGILLEGKVNQMALYVESDVVENEVYQVKKHLLILYSQLLEKEMTLESLNIKVLNPMINRASNGFLMKFDLNINLIVRRDQVYPKELKVYIPKTVGHSAGQNFFNKYGAICSNLKNVLGDYGYETFYQYFNPYKANCTDSNLENDSSVLKESLKLTRSNKNLSGQDSLNFERIWEDNQLDIFIFMARFTNTKSITDGGVRAFNVLVREILDIYGEPVLHELKNGKLLKDNSIGTKNLENVYFRLEYNLKDGRKVFFNLALVRSHEWYGMPGSKGLKDPELLKRYGEAVNKGDFISYISHGDSEASYFLQSEAKKNFSANKYQTMLWISCEGFAHNYPYFFKVKKDKNPSSNEGLLDLILMENYFNYSKSGPFLLAMTESLIESKESIADFFKRSKTLEADWEKYYPGFIRDDIKPSPIFLKETL